METKSQTLRSRWKVLAWSILVLIVLVGAFVGIHEWRTAAARGRYIALRDSLHAQGEPVLPSDLADLYRCDDASNPVIPLRHAATLVPPPLVQGEAPQEDIDDLANLPMVIPLTARERQLLAPEQKTHAEIIADVRDASRRPNAWWNLQIDRPLLTMLQPDLNAQRAMCNVLDHAALLAADRGDFADAFENAALILTPARAMRHYPTMVAYLVSSGYQAIALGRIEDVCAHAQISDSAPKAIRPAAIRQVIQILSDERDENEAIRIAYLADRTQTTESMELLATRKMGLNNEDGLQEKLSVYLARPDIYRTGTMFLEQLSKVAAASSAQDWPTANGMLPPDFQISDSPSLAERLFKIMSPSYSRPIYHHYRTLASRRVAIVALAIHLYRADHGGDLPTSLDQLVPRYLPSIPRDPFVAGASKIRYFRDAGRVYSVNINGIDDLGVDGTEIPKIPGDKTPVSDLGDIVFCLTPRPRPPAPATKPSEE
jgi:hypothetical protein